MTAAYLWLNSVLYAAFGLMCLVRAQSSAESLGYAALTPSGISEYTVVYGGLQLGLAAFFSFLAMSPAYTRVGIIFALCLYAPIVLCRLVSVGMNWPVAPLTLAVGVLETFLLIGAAALAWATMQ